MSSERRRYGQCLSRSESNLSPEIKQRKRCGPQNLPGREYAEYAGFLVFWFSTPCGYSVERGRHCFRFFPATHLSRSVPGTSVYHVVPLLSLLFRLHVAIALLFGSKWRDVFVSPWFSRKKLLAQILGVNNGFF